jgi:hypothetical protein
MLEIKRIPELTQKRLLDKHLEERTQYQLLVHDSNPKAPINRKVAMEACRDSFKFFANNFVWIQNPRAEEAKDKDIPFLLWDFQEQAAEHIIDAIVKGYDLPIEKSRDMGLSWLMMTILVWGWHFHEWECLVGSQKMENVDTRGNIKALLEKARYIVSRLPIWMIPPLERGVHDKSGILVHPDHNASLAGESNNTNFGRSDRRKVILFDEFTSWELTDRAAWQSCSATTKCRIPLSTPNTRGVNCYFYQIVEDHKKKDKPYLRLHWSLHPTFGEKLYHDELGKPRSPWYDSECKRAATIAEVYQELDIDYEASMAGKVFGEFNMEKHVDDSVQYDPMLPLYIAWDFGLDQTAILWIQHQPNSNMHYIIDEYVNDGRGEGDNIYHYLDIIDSKPYKKAIHFGDPHSGENRSLTSGQSNADILRKHGIIFRSQRTKIITRVAAGRNILGNVRISPLCSLTIEMFGSWQMRRPKTGVTTSEVPEHSVHSHIGEAFTYYAFNLSKRFENRKPIKKRSYSPSISGAMI